MDLNGHFNRNSRRFIRFRIFERFKGVCCTSATKNRACASVNFPSRRMCSKSSPPPKKSVSRYNREADWKAYLSTFMLFFIHYHQDLMRIIEVHLNVQSFHPARLHFDSIPAPQARHEGVVGAAEHLALRDDVLCAAPRVADATLFQHLHRQQPVQPRSGTSF